VPISHTLYLNDCLPNGCLVQPGFDDSRSNHSSIAQEPSRLSAYTHGEAHWNELVACVRETFAPFDIDIVTEDPGQASHFEVMIGGTFEELVSGGLMPPTAGGVAPFIGCDGSDDNVISFVFAGTTGAIPYLCAAVAQEAGHVWGLDHALDRKDPMTYLDLGSPKRFQNSEPRCGERLASPRQCWCGSDTQNSFTYLEGLFGLAPDLAPPTLAITEPADGARVAPGFRIIPAFAGPASLKTLTITFDGAPIEPVSAALGIYVGPETISGGSHTLTVTAVDAAERTVTSSITVSTPGAYGETCATVADCGTTFCARDADEAICTFGCTADADCDAESYCRPADAGKKVCWPRAAAPIEEPTDDDGGGCATSQPGAMMALAAFALVWRRRRS